MLTTEEMIERIHDLVMADRKVKVSELAKATGISTGKLFSILHESLGMKVMVPRCLPELL